MNAAHACSEGGIQECSEPDRLLSVFMSIWPDVPKHIVYQQVTKDYSSHMSITTAHLHFGR